METFARLCDVIGLDDAELQNLLGISSSALEASRAGTRKPSPAEMQILRGLGLVARCKNARLESESRAVEFILIHPHQSAESRNSMTPLTLQPIPYQGSKRALAPRIAKLFPTSIDVLYEPFAGSAAVTLYAAQHNLARTFVICDIYPALASLWSRIINQPTQISSEYRRLWDEQFAVGHSHFNEVRGKFNETREPASLLYLIARCVKNAIRFNKNGDFTQSVDKRRHGMHPDKFQATADRVSALLRGKTEVICSDFVECISAAKECDLVYMDPPYHGTTYGRDKRYAVQLERERLVSCLSDLNKRRVPFILSYDGKTGEKHYAELLPDFLAMGHLYIHAGTSSQATLAGRHEETFESLYVSEIVSSQLKELPDYVSNRSSQAELFA